MPQINTFPFSDNFTDVLRRRVRMAIEENSPEELNAVIKEMKTLKLPSIQPDIKYAEEMLQLLKIKKGKCYLIDLIFFCFFRTCSQSV
jgi:hypothetical protein